MHYLTIKAPNMRNRYLVICGLLMLSVACSTVESYDPLEDYRELEPATVLDAPTVNPAFVSPDDRDAVLHGEYMIELLGCGSCHTNGAFSGTPDWDRQLAGSRTGIAYTNPLAESLPGIVYPPNITPDIETGIGGWSDEQIADAIRSGSSRHGGRLSLVMPWRGYALLTDRDVGAMVRYLRNIEPVHHRVPDDVKAGAAAKEPFVYFGIYEEN